MCFHTLSNPPNYTVLTPACGEDSGGGKPTGCPESAKKNTERKDEKKKWV